MLWVALFVPPSRGRAAGITIVMHGTQRNAADYIEDWVDWATLHQRIVACPRFDAIDWPGSRSYNLGNVLAPGEGPGRVNEVAAWSFTVLERLAQRLEARLTPLEPGFDLWGHSAGAQFVHRFALFRPAAPARRMIAAGSGWYTTPDPDTDFPYGTRHPDLSISEERIRRWVATPVTLMRGELDRERDEHLRTTPLADAQGAARWDRAAHMLEAVRAVDPDSPWRLVDVAGSGHDHSAMAAAAQGLLAEG